MPNLLEHRFAIKRITKPSNEDYISALKIYNETTPPDIKTNTNEITYWLEQNRNELPFEIQSFYPENQDAPYSFHWLHEILGMESLL